MSSAAEPDDQAAPEIAETLVLARRAREGDRGALDELFVRYYDHIYRMVRIRLSARLRDVLEPAEAAPNQAANAAPDPKVADPRNLADVIQWLAQAAELQVLATAMDGIHRPSSGPAQPELRHAPAPPDGAVAAARREASFATIVGNAELKELYDACVESLPAEAREMILLRDYARCSWREIVERLGKTDEQSARRAYRRALRVHYDLLRRRLTR